MKLLACCCLVLALGVGSSEGARRVDAKQQLEKSLASMGGSSHRAKREARRMSVRDLMGAGPESDLKVKETGKTVQGTKLWKMVETYRNKPVFDTQLTVETDASGSEVLDASGSFVQGIDRDTDGSPDIYPNEALANVLEEFGDSEEDAQEVKMDLRVFLDKNGEAFTGYWVEYKIEDQGQPRRPTAIVDGRNGRVMLHWNAMTTFCPDAEGVGGNEKTGEVHYDGVNFDCLNVTKIGDTCYLENDDVRVVNMQQSKWYNITETMSYDCQNATDAVNGAYSPALDAFFISTSAYKMFREWYNSSVIDFDKLVVRVHFGEEYPNAYWNGVNATFGDGRGTFHPFVSMDLVGHEIGHAVVEHASGLIWYDQPGAVNEAFADITGEVLEHYIKGHDWLVGSDIVKGSSDWAVRYFIEPEKGFFVISNFTDFMPYMSPHESGGILAHAFYTIVELHNQTMKEAYRVFLHANHMYWHQMSTVPSAVCDIMKSVYDNGQPGEVYKQAFEHVGIQVCDIANHVQALRNNVTRYDISVSNTTRPIFTFSVPAEWTKSVYIKAYSSHGSVHITVTNQTWMEAYESVEEGIVAQDYDSVDFEHPDASLYQLTVTLSSDSAELWTDVSVFTSFKCMSAEEAEGTFFEYLRKENCEGRDY